MSKDRQNIPCANLLMGSMRSMGYTFEAAIADIIDNSISAHSENVQLLFPTNPLETLALGILDDGEGISNDDLFEAMRYGSSSSEDVRAVDDLGRFGLGMKSASMSQCRVLTVASKYKGKVSAYTWDFDYILLKKDWIIKEHTSEEIESIPHMERLKSQEQGTLVVWQNFDVLSKSSDGQVFETLNEYKDSVSNYMALIFHRFLNSKGKSHFNLFVNNAKISGRDPFLENHPKTTTKKEVQIAIQDSDGVERQILVKPFILPYASDLKKHDRALVGGVESLRSKQGFYIYRSNRLIVWGTWFGMKPRSELTKNARIRVDIPNTLDDIWKIDVKKQTAFIPKRIQNQLKRMVNEAFEISINKQTHRGRRDNLADIDYVWNRIVTRENQYYYQVNRESELFKMVKDHINAEGSVYLDLLVREIEQNLPLQQIYIDKSNEAIYDDDEDKASRLKDILNLGITMIDAVKSLNTKTTEKAISDLMKMEPFCKYASIEDKLKKYFKDETDRYTI